MGVSLAPTSLGWAVSWGRREESGDLCQGARHRHLPVPERGLWKQQDLSSALCHLHSPFCALICKDCRKTVGAGTGDASFPGGALC